MNAFEAEGVEFDYGDKPVLKGATLAVPQGGVISLLGANGSGKSTLIRLLLGIQKPKKGQIRLLGKPLASYSRREIARLVAYVPQAASTPFAYTLKEVVLMGRTAHGSLLGGYSKTDHRMADEALEALGIGNLSDRTYNAVSGGQRQLALIARALSQESEILIMDEPVTGLDYGNQQRLLERVLNLAVNGKTVLKTTHFPDHALRVSDGVAVIHDGIVMTYGAPEMTVTPDVLREVYGVDAQIHHIGKHPVCLCTQGNRYVA
ncbi:MAG: ABC transporter ATP-binding protein [Campylobacterales bacterium]